MVFSNNRVYYAGIDKAKVTVNVTNDDFVELDMDVFNELKKIVAEKFPDAVAIYTEISKKNINSIVAAIEKGDGSELEHAAHSLKGSSGQFGAMLLSELARKMELFGKINEIDKAKEIVQDLLDVRRSVEILMLKELN